MIYALITYLAYSLILTIAAIHKDNSSWSVGIEGLDVLLAGPFMWAFLLLVIIFKKPIRKLVRKHEAHKAKTCRYSKNKIDRIVKRVINKAYKYNNEDDVFNLERWFNTQGYWGKAYGYGGLIPDNKKTHKLYSQFMKAMELSYTAQKLAEYFEPFTMDDLPEEDSSRVHWLDEAIRKNFVHLRKRA